MLIDSHCHVPHRKYKKSIEDVLLECKESGVEKIITIGTSIKENEVVIKTVQDYPEVYCTIGIYPHEDRNSTLRDMESHLRNLLSVDNPKILGIGECGIDITNWKSQRPLEEQIELFKMQINLSREYKLPLCIHNRNGSEIIIETLQSSKLLPNPGVIHCYSADWEIAESFLDLGYYLSFSAIITYPSSKNLAEVVQNVPLDKFLVETDAPYLPPQGYRGETNYPKYVRIVAEKVAQLKQIPLEEVEDLSYENTCRLYGIT